MCNFKTTNRMVYDCQLIDVSTDSEDDEEDSTIRRILQRDGKKLLHEEQVFIMRGSGWTLDAPVALILRVSQFNYKHPSGDCYVELPKQLKKRNACINVRNSDNKCFVYSLLVKHIPGVNHKSVLTENSFAFNVHQYNFDGLTYPITVPSIRIFERNNPQVSINVYETDPDGIISPLRVVDEDRPDHFNLLLYRNPSGKSHYIYIIDFNKLIKPQLTKNSNHITVCNRCFCFKETRRCTPTPQAWLDQHTRMCKQHKPTPISLPEPERSYLKFEEHHKAIPLPLILVADFEAYLQPAVSTNGVYEHHEPNSFCTVLKSITLSDDILARVGLSSVPYTCMSDSAGKDFLLHIQDIAQRVETLYASNVPVSNMTQEEMERHAQATACDLCSQPFNELNIAQRKTLHHNHITGHFENSLCSTCNTKAKTPTFLNCYLHNLSNYDSAFIIKNLGVLKDIKVSAIPSNTEKLISFSITFQRLEVRFLDSFRMLPSSLSTLAATLPQFDLIESAKLVPRDKFHLVTRKGSYPYSYVRDSSVFKETHLPPREAFYNHLTEEECSQTDYNHAMEVWQSLNMSTFLDYHMFYLKLDCTLLCDILTSFRKKCLETYAIDPAYEYTLPGYSFRSMLKSSQVNLELLTDPDQLLFVESAIRGGITQCSLRHGVANNHLLECESDFDPNKPKSYLMYLDACNLYGKAMTQHLPYGNFKWVEPDSINWYTLPDDGPTGCFIEADVHVPVNVHDRMQDLPILPEVAVPPNGTSKKLLATLCDKSRYIGHYTVFKQAVRLGLQVTKVHRILSFSQCDFMRKYIELNSSLRKQASDKFTKDLYKLLNNACFGKTMENVRNRVDIRIVTTDTALQKLVRQARFLERRIISENVVLVHMQRSKVIMNKPIYIGMSVLDISKVHMFNFHYNIMQSHFKQPDCQLHLCYMDTDGLLYFLKTERDLMEILKTPTLAAHLDLSIFPDDHPLRCDDNKGVMGTFKDECGGRAIYEFVGLRPKAYAIRFNSKPKDDPATKLKAKGIKSTYVRQHMRFQHYKDALFNRQTQQIAEFNLIRCKSFQLTSVRVTKKNLCPLDDKRHILPCGVRTLPYGHYTLQTEEDGSDNDQP